MKRGSFLIGDGKVTYYNHNGEKIESYKMETLEGDKMENKLNIQVDLNNLKDDEREILLDLIKKGNKKVNKVKRFKPNILGEVYWFVGSTGEVFFSNWHNDAMDSGRYNFNNCFETKAEAEFVSKKKEITAQLEIFAEENNEKIDWKDMTKYKYRLIYDIINKIVTTDYSYGFKNSGVYFSSVAIAKQAIESIGENNLIKYFFNDYER